MDIVIAGGGVAGLEALLALRAMAGDRVRLTLVAPDPDFTYRPLAVAEPFALGHAHRVPLTRFAEDAGAELVVDAVVGRRRRAPREVRLRDAGRALVRRAAASRPAAARWRASRARRRGGRAATPRPTAACCATSSEGYAKRLAIVVPPGAVWPLPAYELALMTAGEARAMGHDDVKVTVVTPERRAAVAVRRGGERGGQRGAARAPASSSRPASSRARDRGGLLLEPGGERLDVQRVFAVPALLGPALDGLPSDEEGFIRRRRRRARARAASAPGPPATASSRRSSSAASPRTRRAVPPRRSRALAGVEDAPDPGEPVLHGRLLVGRRTRRLRGRGDAEGAPLWWPQGKVAGRVPAALAGRARRRPARRPAEPPDGEGITVHRPLSAPCAGAEAQYLFDLARRVRSADPAIASLGRRMHEIRDR